MTPEDRITQLDAENAARHTQVEVLLGGLLLSVHKI
jgi:hypothetical protein